VTIYLAGLPQVSLQKLKAIFYTGRKNISKLKSMIALHHVIINIIWHCRWIPNL